MSIIIFRYELLINHLCVLSRNVKKMKKWGAPIKPTKPFNCNFLVELFFISTRGGESVIEQLSVMIVIFEVVLHSFHFQANKYSFFVLIIDKL